AGVGVFAVKEYGRIYVYLNRCPHLGVPLEWQKDKFLDRDAKLIQCSTHGALFVRSTGECLQGPCRGEFLWQITSCTEDGMVLIEDQELPVPEPKA
ncbi:MAG: Rieske 2Fe-2S domain-containing protein, partial [Pseudohongiellaceae bacterium]